MTTVTVELPPDLALRLEPHTNRLPYFIESGFRMWQAESQPGFYGADEVIELLASLPTPEEVLALQPSEALHARVLALIEKNREEGLTASEEQEWQQFEYLEDLVRIAKASALLKIKSR